MKERLLEAARNLVVADNSATNSHQIQNAEAAVLEAAREYGAEPEENTESEDDTTGEKEDALDFLE